MDRALGPVYPAERPNIRAHTGDSDRQFRFIVTGLVRSEVLDINDNLVGHDAVGIGTGFIAFAMRRSNSSFESEAMCVMKQAIKDGVCDERVADPSMPVFNG